MPSKEVYALLHATTANGIISNVGLYAWKMLLPVQASQNPQDLGKMQRLIGDEWQSQVQVRHESMIKRKLKVKGLTEAGADRMTFSMEESSRKMSVQEYFQERYNYM